MRWNLSSSSGRRGLAEQRLLEKLVLRLVLRLDLHSIPMDGLPTPSNHGALCTSHARACVFVGPYHDEPCAWCGACTSTMCKLHHQHTCLTPERRAGMESTGTLREKGCRLWVGEWWHLLREGLQLRICTLGRP